MSEGGLNDELDLEFRFTSSSVDRTWNEYWRVLQIYLQVTSLMLVVEGYIIAEYVLPSLNGRSIPLAQVVLSVSLIPFFIFIIGLYINKMLERAYSRMIQGIGIIVKIREKIGLLDNHSEIYPKEWITEYWEPLLRKQNPTREDWKEFIKKHLERKNTAFYQIKTLINIINISVISIPIIIFLLYFIK